MKNLNTVKV